MLYSDLDSDPELTKNHSSYTNDAKSNNKRVKKNSSVVPLDKSNDILLNDDILTR